MLHFRGNDYRRSKVRHGMTGWVDCWYEEKACCWVRNEGLGYDALFSRHGGVAECRWNLPQTREVCSRDPEEVRYDGMQDHDHTYGIKYEASMWCLIRDDWCYDVSSDDWVLDVPEKYKTRYLICYEHLEPVLDKSEKCSLDCCKAYSEVPEGYSWLSAQDDVNHKIKLKGYVDLD